MIVADDDGTCSARVAGQGRQLRGRRVRPQPTPAQMRAAPLSPERTCCPTCRRRSRRTRDLAARRHRPGQAERDLLGARGQRGILAASVLDSPHARVLRLSRRSRQASRQRTTSSGPCRATSAPSTSTTSAPPRRDYPLPAFLFRDKVGYCQQFSGAMALMLRMLGIPARVAAGFTPGSYNADTKEYRVRDLDAHSWVEVWFDGHRLGSVRPDAVDRAGRRAVERDAASASGGPATAGEAPDVRDPCRTRRGRGRRAARGRGGVRAAPVFATWLAFAAIALLAWPLRSSSRRAPTGASTNAGWRRRRPTIAALRPRARARPASLRVAADAAASSSSGSTDSGGPARPRATLRMLRERRFGARGRGDARRRRAPPPATRARARSRPARAGWARSSAMPPVLFRRG